MNVRIDAMIDAAVAARARSFARERSVPLSLVVREALVEYVLAHASVSAADLLLPRRATRGYHSKIERARSIAELQRIRARGGRPLRRGARRHPD